MTGPATGRYELQVTDAPSAVAEAAIDQGLSAYNAQQAGHVDARPLGVLLTTPASGEVVGGLLGRTSLGLLFIDLLFVPAEARGGGLGGEVMALAEAEALARGCTAAVLFTITFQAPGFYARCGYSELGRIECEPPGRTRVCMTKRLTPPAALRP